MENRKDLNDDDLKKVSGGDGGTGERTCKFQPGQIVTYRFSWDWWEVEIQRVHDWDDNHNCPKYETVIKKIYWPEYSGGWNVGDTFYISEYYLS